jgi:DNA-binding NarL/FixJ family response regulator
VDSAAAIEYRAGHWRSLAQLAKSLRWQRDANSANQRAAEAGLIVRAIAKNLRSPELRAGFLATPEVAELMTRTETGARVVADPLPLALSGREIEVLRLVATGLTNAQIAERLFLSPKTVSSHLVSIFGKLSVTSRTGATRVAIEHRLV